MYEPDGTVGASTYPLAKKAHSLEFLRTIAHLRPRTKARRVIVYSIIDCDTTWRGSLKKVMALHNLVD